MEAQILNKTCGGKVLRVEHWGREALAELAQVLGQGEVLQSHGGHVLIIDAETVEELAPIVKTLNDHSIECPDNTAYGY